MPHYRRNLRGGGWNASAIRRLQAFPWHSKGEFNARFVSAGRGYPRTQPSYPARDTSRCRSSRTGAAHVERAIMGSASNLVARFRHPRGLRPVRPVVLPMLVRFSRRSLPSGRTTAPRCACFVATAGKPLDAAAQVVTRYRHICLVGVRPIAFVRQRSRLVSPRDGLATAQRRGRRSIVVRPTGCSGRAIGA